MQDVELEPLTSRVGRRTLSWRILASPPRSGRETMRYDAELLTGVAQGTLPATLRFFRFQEPTVSYGRLQKWADVASLVPAGWPSVQRPTGGGVVFHERDLCVSLCWPRGQSPLPARPQDVYRWIHAVIRDGLGEDLTMASCRDGGGQHQPFAVRECFKEPVGYDLLDGKRKVVGGALRYTHAAVLYQGAIRTPGLANREASLWSCFQSALGPSR